MLGMSLTKSMPEHAFFIEPVEGTVHTYGQFLADLNCDSVEGDSESTYAIICKLVSSIARGNDVQIARGHVETAFQDLKSEISGLDNCLRAIRESRSRIQLTTSGTTGQPKPVVHSVSSLTRGVRIDARHEKDTWGLAYPIDHLAGLQVLFQALFNQNTLVQLFDIPTETIHEAIEQYGITHLSCTPTFLRLLLASNRTHKSVTRLTTGGERCDSATASVVNRIFPNARHRNIYALTEVGNLLIADGDQFTVPSELQMQVKVVDGILAIHRSLLADPTIGLLKDDCSYDSPPIDQSPVAQSDWFVTGDLVEILVETPLTFRFSARHDDVINVGGYKVIPQQVEEILLKLPSIQQAVVYGKKNSVTGQIVVCDVVLQPGSQLDSVAAKQTLSDALPRYAVPRIFNIVESLRTTSTGKLCRRSETS